MFGRKAQRVAVLEHQVISLENDVRHLTHEIDETMEIAVGHLKQAAQLRQDLAMQRMVAANLQEAFNDAVRATERDLQIIGRGIQSRVSAKGVLDIARTILEGHSILSASIAGGLTVGYEQGRVAALEPADA